MELNLTVHFEQFTVYVFFFFLALQKSFTVSPRSEQQVRFLCAAGSGVWASCRLDPTLRLFDWTTGRPLQEVDVSSMITKALGKFYKFVCALMILAFKDSILTPLKETSCIKYTNISL